MRRRLRRLAMALVALGTAVAATVPVAAAQGQAAPTPDPVLAILSPIASPVCTTAGTATLLVPIVGGLVETNLNLTGTVDIGDVVLDALGPIYVVCGSLPAAPGTRCLLDDQIAGLVPADLSETLGPTPPVLGGLVDALGATFHLLGLGPADALRPALQCDIRAPEGATAAPSAPPELPAVPGVATVAPPAITAPPASLGAVLPPEVTAVEQPVAAAPTRTLIDLARYAVPGWVQVLQAAAVALILLFLGASWAASLRALRFRRAG